jgi:glutathione-specific gamma-glutamylcyclotransferase
LSLSIEEAVVKIDILTREQIEAGGIDAMATRDAPAMPLLSDAERAESRRQILAGEAAGTMSGSSATAP